MKSASSTLRASIPLAARGLATSRASIAGMTTTGSPESRKTARRSRARTTAAGAGSRA